MTHISVYLSIIVVRQKQDKHLSFKAADTAKNLSRNYFICLQQTVQLSYYLERFRMFHAL